MRILSIIVMVLLGQFGFAQGVKLSTTNGNNTCMKFDSLVYDYGTIGQYDDGMCVLCFKNTCNKDITVGCATSCTCAIAYCSQEPVKPGEYGEVKVRYNTKIPGAFNKSVTVTTYPDQNSVTITIKGLVLKRGT